MDFQIVGVFLAALALSLCAYMSPFKPEHHLLLEARACAPLSLSYLHSDTQLAVDHVPTSESTKRRRLSGLNSRFDRMLWEANLTTRTFKSLSRRHKHAHSSSSSSISNYEPTSTSTHASKDMELGTGEPCFVVVAEEIHPHKTMQQVGVGLSPSSNNEDQVLSGILPWGIDI